MSLPAIFIDNVVRNALLEDLGHGHDSTAQVLIPEEQTAKLVIRAREQGILAGIQIAKAAFAISDPSLNINTHISDGQQVKTGDTLLTVSGNARSAVQAERTALNFLSHMCGIATKTNEFVRAVQDTKARIACTRKTLPGLRSIQKYAVKTGGGINHRFGLDDGILIKDNHIAIAGGIDKALELVFADNAHMLKIEVEVDTIEQLEIAMNYPVDAVLLDNMDEDSLSRAVHIIDGRALSEASGNVNIETVKNIALTGVDIISVGALTHSAHALDLGLDIEF